MSIPLGPRLVLTASATANNDRKNTTTSLKRDLTLSCYDVTGSNTRWLVLVLESVVLVDIGCHFDTRGYYRACAISKGGILSQVVTPLLKWRNRGYCYIYLSFSFLAMHYLEDYLEVIEFLPEELKTRLQEIKAKDERVQSQLQSLDDRSRTFFTLSRKNKQEWREQQFNNLQEEYQRALSLSEEKVKVANEMYELMGRYMKRLDHDLNLFTLELEADTAGITEILEQRSYQLDQPPSPERPSITHKRRHTHHDDLLDHDDLSPTPSTRSSPIQTRIPQYSRRERKPTISLAFSTEHDHDLFDFGDDPLTDTPTSDLYAGTGGKPSLTFLGDTRANRRKLNTAASLLVDPPVQDEYVNYVDPNEPRYCLCNQVSYGEMICCDNPTCSIEWFHYGCVGIAEAPKGKWYCPQCVAQTRRKSRK